MEAPRRIETDRLVLEAIDTRHADELFDAAEACRPYLARWLDWAATLNRNGVRAFVKESVRNWKQELAYVFAITLDGEAIGVVDLRRGSAPNTSEMGYWMSEAQAGKGYMTEAVAALVDLGFRRLGMHRIALFAGTENIGSQRVAERVGFRREGIARHASRAIEGYYDCYLYGLLETDARLEMAPR